MIGIRYCVNIEDVENYEKAKEVNFEDWHLHHRLETHNSDGVPREVAISRKELIALDMYYNRPAEELIFLTKKEHSALHAHFTDKNPEKISKTLKLLWQDPEFRQRKSEAHKGKHPTEETKQKISETLKGKPKNRQVKHWKLVDGKRVWY